MRQRIHDKRDRVRQLRIFCEVARLGSISRASERLALTQPAVSIQVRELEHEFGVVLLEREPTGVSPTPAGERLLALAAPLVQGVDELFANVRHSLDTVRGARVHVAASNAGASYILPPYVRRFRDRCPDTTVCLDSMPLREGLERLLDERADLVCGVEAPCDEEVIRYHELFTYDIVLVTPLDHPLAGRRRVTPHEAGAHRAVVPPKSTYSLHSGESAAHAFGLDHDSAIQVGSWNEIKRHVEAGIGISLVPSFCVSETDRLSVVSLDTHFPRRSYGVYTARDRRLTPPAQRFHEVLVPDGRGPRGVKCSGGVAAFHAEIELRRVSGRRSTLHA